MKFEQIRWICEQSKLASIELDTASFSELHFEYSENQVPKLGNQFSHSFLTSNFFFFFAIKCKGHGDLITLMCRKLKFIRHLYLTIYPSIFLASFST